MTDSAAIRRVLVIDDDEVMRDLLSMVLGIAGYEVTTAASGNEALLRLVATAAKDMPECVLADMQMPGVCGAELGERLREICPPATLRLAMSGSDLRADEGAAFDGFLLKPFSAEDFVEAVEHHRVHAENETPEDAGSEGDGAVALDEGVYRKLAASMPAVQLQQLYMLCLDDAGARIARMHLAATEHDSGLFVREAHAIKGGCGMLGATELHMLAGRMEAGALASTPLLEEFTRAADRLRRMLEARP